MRIRVKAQRMGTKTWFLVPLGNVFPGGPDPRKASVEIPIVSHPGAPSFCADRALSRMPKCARWPNNLASPPPICISTWAPWTASAKHATYHHKLLKKLSFLRSHTEKALLTLLPTTTSIRPFVPRRDLRLAYPPEERAIQWKSADSFRNDEPCRHFGPRPRQRVGAQTQRLVEEGNLHASGTRIRWFESNRCP